MSDEPDCPVCPFTPMNQVDSGLGFTVDECPQCGGRWYDASELERVVKDAAKFKAALDKGLLKPRPGQRICPRCQGALVNGGLVSELLRVDFCERCRGFWLDKRELDLVDKLLSS